jgi:hypothetical protein
MKIAEIIFLILLAVWLLIAIAGIAYVATRRPGRSTWNEADDG